MQLLTDSRLNQPLTDVSLLLMRLFVGCAMISHGFPKLQLLMEGGDASKFDIFGLGGTFTLALVVIAEVVCSIFIILGLFTRPAALILLITMGVAAFVVHSGDPFSSKELSLLYMFIYVIFVSTGAGKFSIDQMITAKRNASRW